MDQALNLPTGSKVSVFLQIGKLLGSNFWLLQKNIIFQLKCLVEIFFLIHILIGKVKISFVRIHIDVDTIQPRSRMWDNIYLKIAVRFERADEGWDDCDCEPVRGPRHQWRIAKSSVAYARLTLLPENTQFENVDSKMSTLGKCWQWKCQH